MVSARREAVADYYAQRGEHVDVEQIVLTASTSEAYGFLFKLLCDPGDAVLVPTPSYPLFGYLAALEHVETRSYPLLRDERFRVDLGRSSGASTPARARSWWWRRTTRPARCSTRTTRPGSSGLPAPTACR